MDRTSSFGYWLRRRRKALDLTQAELAQCVGCAAGTIKRFEAEERRPSKPMAERLADCLELVGEERVIFLRAARSDLVADQLAPPSQLADQASQAHALAEAQPAAGPGMRTLGSEIAAGLP